MNPKEIIRKLKEGYKKLTLLDHAKAKMQGHIGAVVGGLLAMIVLMIREVWFIVVFIGAITWLQYVELRKEVGNVAGLEKMELELKKLEEE